jgi:tyrosine-protein phosphatase SIW14
VISGVVMKSLLRVVRTLCVAVAVMASVGPSAAPQSHTRPSGSGEHSPTKKLALPGVKNFGEVTTFLYRGAQPSSEGFKTLAGMGIDIVVDVRLSGRDNERKTVTALGMQYVSIPWHCLFPKDEKIAQFLALLRDNPRKKVFVHCRYGDDRTGMMIAAYRMAEENWTADEAWKEMQKFGLNHVLCIPLGSYEKSFPERLKKNAALRGAVVTER